jgi:hypothetical protein
MFWLPLMLTLFETEVSLRLEEEIDLCLPMWSEDNAPYRGSHNHLAETLTAHPPVTQQIPAPAVSQSTR